MKEGLLVINRTRVTESESNVFYENVISDFGYVNRQTPPTIC